MGLAKKINNAILNIQKAVDSAQKFNESLEEISRSYNGRKISFNVKIYDYIDKSDVIDQINNYLKSNVASPEKISEVEKEFNEDRLHGIFNHTLEVEALSLLEYAHSLGINKELTSFHGRSGGWFTIGETYDYEISVDDFGSLPFWSFEKFISKFNVPENPIERLKEYFGHTTLKQVYNEVDYTASVRAVHKGIKEYKKLFRDIKNYIENRKKRFKTEYITRLYDEIHESFKEKITFAEEIEICERTYNYSFFDKIDLLANGKYITSQKAAIEKKIADTAIELLLNGQSLKSKKIGPFAVTEEIKTEKDTYLKIGCHRFSLKKTIEQINKLH